MVAVVLSGNLNDGTAGLLAIKKCGGVAVVQDPSEASCPAMPRSGGERARVDYCLPLSGIAPLLSTLASDATDEDRPAPSEMEAEIEIATGETNEPEAIEKLGRLSDSALLRNAFSIFVGALAADTAGSLSMLLVIPLTPARHLTAWLAASLICG